MWGVGDSGGKRGYSCQTRFPTGDLQWLLPCVFRTELFPGTVLQLYGDVHPGLAVVPADLPFCSLRQLSPHLCPVLLTSKHPARPAWALCPQFSPLLVTEPPPPAPQSYLVILNWPWGPLLHLLVILDFGGHLSYSLYKATQSPLKTRCYTGNAHTPAGASVMHQEEGVRREGACAAGGG